MAKTTQYKLLTHLTTSDQENQSNGNGIVKLSAKTAILHRQTNQKVCTFGGCLFTNTKDNNQNQNKIERRRTTKQTKNQAKSTISYPSKLFFGLR